MTRSSPEPLPTLELITLFERKRQENLNVELKAQIAILVELSGGNFTEQKLSNENSLKITAETVTQ